MAVMPFLVFLNTLDSDMDNCLECKRASECHDEHRKIIGILTEGIKSLNRGYFMQGTEAMELAIIHLETMDNKNNGRVL